MSATLVKPEHVYNLIKKHQTIYWSVKTLDKGMMLGDNQEAISTTEACRLLAEVLAGIKGRSVLVELRPKPRKQGAGGDMKSNFFDCIVDISDNLPANERGNYSSAPQINGIEEILRQRDEINGLKMEMFKKEMEDTKASPLMKIAEKFAENEKLINAVSDRLLNALLPPPPPPRAAINANNLNSQDEQLKDVLIQLQKLDADYINTLTHLANYLQQYPGMIDEVKAMITPK